MDKIELLAPAGSLESLYAAVQAGADAVYLGGSKFSARAYASNFDEEGMQKAIEYCHLYGVKVYITINTLIKEEEMEEALTYVNFLYAAGVDALIIQDVGAAYLIRKNFPELELHASTQMTIHNGEGAMFLKEKGFQRIVLSRELSIDEIRHISKDLGVETEIFIHGALCICYSGQCLMSSLIGGRSGNRGRCAQPCRLPYTLIEEKTKTERSGYLLSPKDICTLSDIEKIIESGTSSLKIEGRMKRPEYVAGVVDIYRRAIDSVYNSEFFDFEGEYKKLLQLFNREGFSKAYLFGNMGKDMMAYKYPKNMGIYLGKANQKSEILLEESLKVKDGIRVGEEGFHVTTILKNGKEVVEAAPGDKVKLVPTHYRAGEMLYKTSDEQLLSELARMYQNPYDKKIPLELFVTFTVGKPLTLKTVYKQEIFICTGETVQTALKKPLDQQRLIENLSKSGDTAFKFDYIKFESFEKGFLPISAINEVRRSLLEKVEVYAAGNGKRKTLNEIKLDQERNYCDRDIPKEIIYISTEEQLKAAEHLGISCIAFNPWARGILITLEKIKAPKIYIKVPTIIKEEFSSICNYIDKHLSSIAGIMTNNAGIIYRYHQKTEIIGDYKLNLFNSYSSQFYKQEVQGAALSVELNKQELQQILRKGSSFWQMLVYGKAEMMISEYCAIGSVYGGKCSESSCSNACERSTYELKDRKGERFPVKTDRFCRSYIYNPAALNLIPHMEELRKMGLTSFRLDFVDESYDDTTEIIKAYLENNWKREFTTYTRGHYKRGVE